MRRLSLVAVSRNLYTAGGTFSSWSAQASHCGGFSCCRAGLLGYTVLALGLSCLAACRIFLDQGWNPCPVHWEADS